VLVGLKALLVRRNLIDRKSFKNQNLNDFRYRQKFLQSAHAKKKLKNGKIVFMKIYQKKISRFFLIFQFFYGSTSVFRLNVDFQIHKHLHIIL